MRRRHPAQLLIVAAISADLVATPCFAAGDPADPLEKMNRGFFRLEMVLDHVILGPVAFLYSHLVPKPLQKGVRNVVRNLGEPVVFANDLLQGRGKTAGRTAGRFVMNSTLGIAGLFDVAKRAGVPRHSNDFGITLGKWGVKSGPYLFLPLVGPSSFRDTVGKGGDYGLNPITYARFDGRTALTIGVAALGGIGQRSEANQGLRTVMETSTDPYATIRSFYLQDREAQIHGGPATEIGPLPELDEGPEPIQPGNPSATPPATPPESSSELPPLAPESAPQPASPPASTPAPAGQAAPAPKAP